MKCSFSPITRSPVSRSWRMMSQKNASFFLVVVVQQFVDLFSNAARTIRQAINCEWGYR